MRPAPLLSWVALTESSCWPEHSSFLFILSLCLTSQTLPEFGVMASVVFSSVGEVKSTQDRKCALHLFRLGDAMLRIVRSKARPLLHVMRCWSLVAPHLVEVSPWEWAARGSFSRASTGGANQGGARSAVAQYTEKVPIIWSQHHSSVIIPRGI